MKKSIISAIGLALVLAVAVIGQSKGQPTQRQAHSSVFIYAAINDDTNGFSVSTFSASGPNIPEIHRGTPIAEFDAQAMDAGFVLQPQVHHLVLHYVR